jgi:hypothetical protein
MDKNTRRALKNSVKAAERQKFLAAMPLSVEKTQALFDFVAAKIGPIGDNLASSCDHTLRYAKVWCAQNNVAEVRLVEWLQEHGGFCDCEILWNVDERLEEALGVETLQ